MATLTVTATALGSYMAKVINMTVAEGDSYHVLHGLGATPHELHYAMRSHPNASLPLALVLGSYNATMAWFSAMERGTGWSASADVVIKRTHSIAI